MIEVYKEFPWVKLTERATEFVLRNEAGYEDYYEINGQIHDGNFGCWNSSFIDPKYVVSANDGSIYDDEMTQYFYCEILMESGERYYLPDIWKNREKYKETVKEYRPLERLFERGQTCYLINNKNKIIEFTVDGFLYSSSDRGLIFSEKNKCWYDCDDLGKTLFKTREEAEKKLKELGE